MPRTKSTARPICRGGHRKVGRSDALRPISTPFGLFRLSAAARQMLAAFAHGETVYLPKSPAELAEQKRIHDEENQRWRKAGQPLIPDPPPVPFHRLAQLAANQKIFATLEQKGLIAKDAAEAKVRLTPEGWAVLEAKGAVRRKTKDEIENQKES